MRLNEHTAISAPKVLLVPYSKHHVPTYHEWMQDESLRAATASEPLTLAEEYAMQRSWRTDRDKLTFIICEPNTSSTTSSSVLLPEADRPSTMLGDVNLFLFDDENEDGDDGDINGGEAMTADPDEPKTVIAELELMIASPKARRKGFGRAALGAFLHYVRRNLDDILLEYAGHARSNGQAKRDVQLGYLRVRIGQGNEGSLALFEGLGFKRLGDGPNYFGEVELRRNLEWMGDEGDAGIELTYKTKENEGTNGISVQ